ncbi:MAG: hypothetical protein SFU83_04185 [Meiothermus sp.]|nr:hypothetical protein [Meiothermus sp.]
MWLLFIFLSLTGCQTAPSNVPVSQPDSLLGTDGNSNGIRDDVDELIGRLTNKPEERTRIASGARALQTVFSSVSSTQKANEVKEAYYRAVFCSSQGLEKAFADVFTTTVNSDKRIREYLRVQQMSSQISFTFEPSACPRLTSSVPREAHTLNAQVDRPDITVRHLHINGVNTCCDEVSANWGSLFSRISQIAVKKYGQSVAFQQQGLENPSHKLINDLYEANLQLNPNATIENFWKAFRTIVPGSEPYVPAKLVADRLTQLPPEAREVTLKYLSTINESLQRGEKVLITAHSQGTIFARDIERLVGTNPDVRFIDMAPPFNDPGKRLTISKTGDVLLWFVRLYNDVFPGNISITDGIDHSLRSYIDPNTESGRKFDEYVDRIITEWLPPIDLTGDWDAQGYTCFASTVDYQDIGIRHTDTQIIAQKIIGDPCVPAGNLTFVGNIARSQVVRNALIPVTFAIGTPRCPACYTTAGRIRIINRDSFVAETPTFITFTRVKPLEPSSAISALLRKPW